MSNIVLDKDSFYRRIKRLYANWKEPEFSHDDSLSKVDCIVTAVGVDEETIYSKSTSLQTWLLGYELTDTITVLCEKAIYFLTSKKKIDFLKQIEREAEENVPTVKLLVRDKVSVDGEEGVGKGRMNSCDIRYSEGIQSLNWAKIMKTIVDDPEGFFDNGGWTFLDPESDGEGAANSETEDEEDDAYEPTDDDDPEESDDSEDYSEASEDDSASDEGGIELVSIIEDSCSSKSSSRDKHHHKDKHGSSSGDRHKDKHRSSSGGDKHRSSSGGDKHKSSSSSSHKRSRDDSRDGSSHHKSKKSKK
ncbi:conserved hypothetical protein [Culex quinquefasciatus]|uniref:FACT complex subunit n=1 Tax=Culex quinquefasciatus TaxID=7176 RepID=B0WLU5_CULQU|nr:conserved hypothetical protein [Culex quinquefasciatus]|eukprot:XP_001849679.1 conserved hypothetical protein [Culex quinquefasciatus]